MIDKIYVTHWKPLTDRYEYLSKRLKKLNLFDKTIFMTRWDKNEIDLKDTEQFYQKNNVKDWVKKGNIKNIYSMNENSFRNLKEAEIFNMLNHIECYNDIYKNKYKNCLILEDDCIILNDNFEEKINYILSSNIKDTYDFVFMGNYCIKNIICFYKIFNAPINPIYFK